MLWCLLHLSCVSDFPCVCFRDCVAWCWQSADPQFVEKRSLGGPACLLGAGPMGGRDRDLVCAGFLLSLCAVCCCVLVLRVFHRC